MLYILVAARTLLAVVLAASLLGKLRGRSARRDFVSAVERMAPGWSIRVASPSGGSRRTGARAVAAAVLAAEAVSLALLLAPSVPALGLLCAVALLTAFTAALVGVLRSGDRVPCACFGSADRPVRPAHMVRNLLLVAAGTAGLAAAAAGPHPGGEAAALAVAVATGACAALPVLLLDDLLDLFTPLTPGSPP
ncbi:hypothetical protein SUDANB121_05645 [Nocardiopsis dassonvillei]|uniref:MauE/DoxX family redox-associated membrane protein n=1 Tax=Nocardiopsis dassonvillei TaxID=2014 RepID=UPI003F557034